MQDEPIEDVLVRLESQTFERKTSLSRTCRGEGLKSLCGMINTDFAQGRVAFGIADDGELVGVESGDLDTAQRTLAQSIRDDFEPPIQSDVRVLERDGRQVIVVSAQRNRAVAYHEFAGRAFIREGTATRQLTFVEKQSLQRQRNRDLHTGPWRCDRCGAFAGMLSAVEITEQGIRKTYKCSCGGEYWPAT